MKHRNRTENNASIAISYGSLFRTMTVAFCCLLLATVFRGCEGQDQMNPRQQIAKLQQSVKEDPRNAEARFLLGWSLITMMGISDQASGILKTAFNPNKVDTPLHQTQPLKAFLASHLIGRIAKEKKDTREAHKWLLLAYDISKNMLSPDKDIGEYCTHMLLASNLHFYPLSNEDADEALASSEEWSSSLIDFVTVLKKKEFYLNQDWLAQAIPGFANDPYIHCAGSLFPLSFYYRADVAKIANFNHEIMALTFPKLLYTAHRVKDFDARQQLAREEQQNTAESDDSPLPVIQECVDRKIRLGVISATFTEGHSVSQDFGGILSRLDREMFDVSYHFLHEQKGVETNAEFLTANPTDRLFHYYKSDKDINDGAWVRRWDKELEEFQLDMILYLDMTMSTFTRRLGMGRLAPVQINTHGHPVTSGIPRDIVQHFVSWAEAELPIEQSQTHYSEQLQLIPKGKIHQYYTPRLVPNSDGHQISRNTGMRFDHLTRKSFPELSVHVRSKTPDDDDIHLYVCMQKPFKVFPEFDELLCGVLRDDPQGYAVLHEEGQSGHTDVFIERLKKAGCDMDRVNFLPVQPHHRLMALYKTATVVLDSYPAGGCTTSREALELGKAIVTWPARLLGGRWTLGLFNAIGLDAETQSKLVANSKEEYIAKAVALGTNRSLREGVEKNILEAVPTLFEREEAVEEWQKIILKVSPVKHCTNGDGNNDDVSDKDEL